MKRAESKEAEVHFGGHFVLLFDFSPVEPD
jgi:hypothetical protein